MGNGKSDKNDVYEIGLQGVMHTIHNSVHTKNENKRHFNLSSSIQIKIKIEP